MLCAPTAIEQSGQLLVSFLLPNEQDMFQLAVTEDFDDPSFLHLGYGMSIGFKAVISGPLVRSSYMADHVDGEARRT